MDPKGTSHMKEPEHPAPASQPSLSQPAPVNSGEFPAVVAEEGKTRAWFTDSSAQDAGTKQTEQLKHCSPNLGHP